MVKEVWEVRDEPVVLGIVIVGAEDRGELGVFLEDAADPLAHVRMDLDVGVYEQEDIPGCLPCADIPRLSRHGNSRRLDNDQLFSWVDACPDRCDASRESGRRVSGRNDNGDHDHQRKRPSLFSP